MPLTLPFASALVAAFAAAVIAVRPSGPRHARTLLAALLGLFACYGLGVHLAMTDGFRQVPHLSRVGSTVALAFMPLLFLYARSLAEPGRSFGLRDLWHGVPLLAQVLLRLPFFLLPAAVKLQQLEGAPDRILNRTVTLLLALLYLGPLFRLWGRHERWLTEAHSRLEGRHLTWILWMHGCWTLVAAAEWVASLGIRLPGLGLWVVPLAIFLTAFVSLVRSEGSIPAEGRSLPGLEVGSAPEDQGPVDPSAPEPVDVPVDPRGEQVLARVLDLLERDPLYLDPDLSLAGLAGRLRLPPSYVSRALNQGLGQNFFTFINQRRVEAAARLLREAPGRTVLDIGLASGFASKSTFNAAFKKVTGLTPTEWRQQGAELQEA